jgi:hypothetical protein
MIREWGCNAIVTGGDLVFFIKGLQDAVRDIKSGAGEAVDDAHVAGGAAA